VAGRRAAVKTCGYKDTNRAIMYHKNMDHVYGARKDSGSGRKCVGSGAGGSAGKHTYFICMNGSFCPALGFSASSIGGFVLIL
jgi:hypothetical protein